MPETIRKLPGGGYRVSTPGGVKAKHTTKEHAEAQARLLRGIDHGMVPRGRNRNAFAERMGR